MDKENIKYKLPQGWIWTTVGELGLISSGSTPSTRERQFWDGEIPWITPADLSGYTDKYISKGKRSITELGLDYSSCRLLPTGTIVFSSRAPIGYVAITKAPLATNQGFKNLTPVDSVSNEYVYYYLSSAKQLAESAASGTTFLELSAKAFSKLQIPLAPYNEQKKIVSKIEEILSEIDYSTQSLSIALQQLSVYRLAVLKKAYDGNYSSNKKEWKVATIGKLTNLISGQHILEKDYNQNNTGVPYLTGPSDFGTTHPLITKWTTDPKVLVNTDCVLITVKGSGVGKVNYLNFKAAIGRQLMALTSEKILPLFLYYYLILNQSQIRNMGSGSAIPGINRDMILSYSMPYCNIDEQQSCIKLIEAKFSVIDNLEQSINDIKRKLLSLKFSVLKKAFSGQLIKQDDSEDEFDLKLKISREKELLVELQKQIDKTKPKQKMNIENLSIIEVLQRSKTPMRAVDVWKESKHRENVEEFYSELKSIRHQIREIKKDTELLITLTK